MKYHPLRLPELVTGLVLLILSDLGVGIPSATAIYVPPPEEKSRQGDAGGSRGCNWAQATSSTSFLELLAPEDHMAQTISAHPTFLLHASKPISVPVRFSLAQPGVPEPVYQKELNISSPGFYAVSLPKKAKLEVGEEYRWTITLVCNDYRPSSNVRYWVWIKRVPTSAALQRNLSTAKSPRDRADAFARSGIWYDAVATAYQSSHQDPLASRYFKALLEQVELVSTEDQEQTGS